MPCPSYNEFLGPLVFTMVTFVAEWPESHGNVFCCTSFPWKMFHKTFIVAMFGGFHWATFYGFDFYWCIWLVYAYGKELNFTCVLNYGLWRNLGLKFAQGFATTHSTSTASAVGSRLVKCVHSVCLGSSSSYTHKTCLVQANWTPWEIPSLGDFHCCS